MSPKSGLAHQPQTRNKGNTSPKWAPVLSHSPKSWLKIPPAAAFCPVQGTKTPSTAHLPGSHFHFQQQSTINPRFVLPPPPAISLPGSRHLPTSSIKDNTQYILRANLPKGIWCFRQSCFPDRTRTAHCKACVKMECTFLAHQMIT